MPPVVDKGIGVIGVPTVYVCVPVGGETHASGPPPTVMLNAPLSTAGLLAWSTTWTVKFDMPEPVGVPEMTPDVFIVSPVGSDPPVIVNVLVPVPPATPIVAPG